MSTSKTTETQSISNDIKLLKLLCDFKNKLVKYVDKGHIITNEEIIRKKIKNKWFINLMPDNLLKSPYISTEYINQFVVFSKKYKYKLWGFKNEFLKAYDYVIKNKFFYDEILDAEDLKCPYCGTKYEKDVYKLYVVHNSNYGNFCWGTLMSHLISDHNYKPPRFFIEYTYYMYCRNIYGLDMNIIKLDENTLKYFEIMSRTGYDKKFGFSGDKPDYNKNSYNIKYNGNIIGMCNRLEKKATNIKTRIKNIGIFFGKALIQNNNIVLYNTESIYDRSMVNYLYYIHPYNYREINYNNFKIDIPQYEEYSSFIDLYRKQGYNNLLGLLIFANEGVYVISKVNDDIDNLKDRFNQQNYQKIIEDTKDKYLEFIDKYKKETNKEDLIYKDIKYCYEQYQYEGSWIEKINDIIKPCNFKVSYFPKITIDKSNNVATKRYESIYDTLYLPVNKCFQSIEY